MLRSGYVLLCGFALLVLAGVGSSSKGLRALLGSCNSRIIIIYIGCLILYLDLYATMLLLIRALLGDDGRDLRQPRSAGGTTRLGAR